MIFWKRHPKDEGISCVIRARDEQEWVELSLFSILDFADEIIFVDNGSKDRTLEMAREFKEKFGVDKMKVFTFPPVDAVKVKSSDLYNFAYKKATKSWVMKWDPDFIARTDQKYSILELKELWWDEKGRVDSMRISLLNLWGDHLHYREKGNGNPEVSFENYLFRNKGWKVIMNRDHGWEQLKLSKRHKGMYIGPRADPGDKRIFWFHMAGLKPDEKIFFRSNMSAWSVYCLTTKIKDRLRYEEWLARRWGTPVREEQVRKMMKACFTDGHLKPLRKVGGEWGGYPVLLKPYLEAPRYLVQYEQGKPVGRTVKEEKIPLPEEYFKRQKSS